MKPILVLLLFLLIVFAIAFTGSWFQSGEWYESLSKPTFNPPDWLFGPVWTVLYILIALSGWLVWREAGFSTARAAFIVYFIQLIFNASWLWIFFGLHRPALAFAHIMALWFFILLNVILFSRINKIAALLLFPYYAWVSFASILNMALWRLNK